MRWLNSEYIKELSEEEFLALATPYFDRSKIKGKYDYRKLAALLHKRTEILGEIPEKVDFLEEFRAFDTDMFFHKKMKVTKELALNVLKASEEVLSGEDNWTNERLQELVGVIAERCNVKGGQVFLPLRLALTASPVSPGGATEMADLLGKEESMRRLRFSIDLLEKDTEL